MNSTNKILIEKINKEINRELNDYVTLKRQGDYTTCSYVWSYIVALRKKRNELILLDKELG